MWGVAARSSVVVEARYLKTESGRFDTREGKLLLSIYLILSGTQKWFPETASKVFLVGRARSARKVDKLTVICEPTA
jgi:hypothetical protein